MKLTPGPIGVFDSGYGGLTVLKELVKELPQYDYLYLGDNARTPYGTRSYDIVYDFTLSAVKELFNRGCNLVILACNTASAKALRTIQMNDLPNIHPDKRVLGVIRPSTETLGELSQTKHVGILATNGTVNSGSYTLELKKFFPDIQVTEMACPMWVPLIENDEHESIPGREFIRRDFERLLSQNSKIDTVALACTHYPLIMDYLQKVKPPHVQVVAQGELVAAKLKEYLMKHQNLEQFCTQSGKVNFLTTENASLFSEKASLFYGRSVQAEQIKL